MKIALVLSQPPAYSETFLRSKIKGLQRNGMDVTLYCRKKQASFDLCPVVLRPRVSENPIIQLWCFMLVFLELLPYYKVVRRYVSLERRDGTRGVTLLKQIYLNAHLLKAQPDWVHFGFATMAIGSETVAQAIGAKMGVSFRGFDMGTYPIKNPGCY
ncbi:MAG TPA: hypothetical protein VKY45_05540, partial [Marinilabiliaceae bacterium]|nr:hypothetical protein [Marinilabiliaceae bacterium]